MNVRWTSLAARSTNASGRRGTETQIFVGNLLFLAQRTYIDATLPWRCLNKNADGEEKSHDKLRSKERKLI